jgi:hypothetical protein
MPELNRKKLLVHEAKRWLRTVEVGGNNRGQVVEMFQRIVDDKAFGEPWCMAFVQYCIHHVDTLVLGVWPELLEPGNSLIKSEWCYEVWEKSPAACRKDSPAIGRVAIWKSKSGTDGHTGIVVRLFSDGEFETIEGNTSQTFYGSQSNGDGVFSKRRGKTIANMELLGFLDPWPIA